MPWLGSVGEVIAEITALAFLSPEVQTCAHDLESPLEESCSGVVMGKGDTEEVPEGDREPREPFLFVCFNVFTLRRSLRSPAQVKGTQGFPAATLERHREFFFNPS